VASPGSHDAAPRGLRPLTRQYVFTADLESALRRADAADREHETHNGRSYFQRSNQDMYWPALVRCLLVAGRPGTDVPS
jgi:hypothetical protein